MIYSRHYCYRIDFADGFVYFGSRTCQCSIAADSSYTGTSKTYAAKWLTDTPRVKSIVSVHATRKLAYRAESVLIRDFWAASIWHSLNGYSPLSKLKVCRKAPKAPKNKRKEMLEVAEVADAYALAGQATFKPAGKRSMHDWVNTKRLSTLPTANWHNLGEIIGIDLSKSDSTRLVRDYSNSTTYNAKDIAAKLAIGADESFALVDQALDLAEQSPNAFPKHYAKRRAAIKAMSLTGKMTEADIEMFGTKQIKVALASVGLKQVRGTGNKHKGVEYNEFYKAVRFAVTHPRLVQLQLDPDNASDIAEQLDKIEWLAEDIAYAKANWPARLTDEIRDFSKAKSGIEPE